MLSLMCLNNRHNLPRQRSLQSSLVSLSQDLVKALSSCCQCFAHWTHRYASCLSHIIGSMVAITCRWTYAYFVFVSRNGLYTCARCLTGKLLLTVLLTWRHLRSKVLQALQSPVAFLLRSSPWLSRTWDHLSDSNCLCCLWCCCICDGISVFGYLYCWYWYNSMFWYPTFNFSRNYACAATALVFVGSDVTKGSGTVAGEAVVSSNQQNVFAGQKTFFRSG